MPPRRGDRERDDLGGRGHNAVGVCKQDQRVRANRISAFASTMVPGCADTTAPTDANDVKRANVSDRDRTEVHEHDEIPDRAPDCAKRG